MEPGGKSERRTDAFSEPGPVAPVADFALRSGAVSRDSSGLAVARLDHELHSDLLSRNLCRLLYAGRLSRSDDYCSLRRKDSARAEAGDAASGGRGKGTGPETASRA